MRYNKGVFILLLTLLLALLITACGGTSAPSAGDSAAEAVQSASVETAAPASDTEAAQPEAEPEPDTVQSESQSEPEASAAQDVAPPEQETADFPVEGEYTMFAMGTDGFIVDSADLDRQSVLTLEADGTGNMTIDSSTSSDSMPVSSWSVEDTNLNVTMEDGSTATGIINNGVIELDLFGTGDSILYFAREGADTTGYEVLSQDEYLAALDAAHDSRLYALWKEMDGGAGVHLRYRLHTENLDSDQDFDVHGKEGVYYSLRTTHVGSLEGKTITFFQDGTAYNLDPDDMTGIIATTTSSEIVLNSPILMDSLWKLIWTRAQELAYTTEEREMEGKTYSVEVFPASEYQGEAAFYFDQDGTLRYCVEGATEISAALGELTYTIEEINDHVDESLFDISEYTIS